MGHKTLRHSNSSGARSRIECRGPAAREGVARSIWLFVSHYRSTARHSFWFGFSFGRRRRTGEEAVGSEHAAFQGAVEGRPVPYSLIGSEGRTHCGHLGIEVVQIMEHQGFAEHRQLGRTEFIFSMMRNEHVLDECFQCGRKS